MKAPLVSVVLTACLVLTSCSGPTIEAPLEATAPTTTVAPTTTLPPVDISVRFEANPLLLAITEDAPAIFNYREVITDSLFQSARSCSIGALRDAIPDARLRELRIGTNNDVLAFRELDRSERDSLSQALVTCDPARYLEILLSADYPTTADCIVRKLVQTNRLHDPMAELMTGTNLANANSVVGFASSCQGAALDEQFGTTTGGTLGEDRRIVAGWLIDGLIPFTPTTDERRCLKRATTSSMSDDWAQWARSADYHPADVLVSQLEEFRPDRLSEVPLELRDSADLWIGMQDGLRVCVSFASAASANLEIPLTTDDLRCLSHPIARSELSTFHQLAEPVVWDVEWTIFELAKKCGEA